MQRRPIQKQKVFHKPKKGRIQGVTQPVILKHGACVGIYSCENAKISSKTLQAVQRVIQQSVTRRAKIELLSFPHIALTKKPSEVRIGKGRGGVSTFVARVRCGDLIQQLSDISVDEGLKALKKVQQILGIKTQLITRLQPSVSVKFSVISLSCQLIFFKNIAKK